MDVSRLTCDEETELHIWSRHRVTMREVEEAAHRNRLTLRGRAPAVYEVYGRTESGRYLMVATRHTGKGEARLITARDMTQTERRRYLRQIAH